MVMAMAAAGRNRPPPLARAIGCMGQTLSGSAFVVVAGGAGNLGRVGNAHRDWDCHVAALFGTIEQPGLSAVPPTAGGVRNRPTAGSTPPHPPALPLPAHRQPPHGPAPGGSGSFSTCLPTARSAARNRRCPSA